MSHLSTMDLFSFLGLALHTRKPPRARCPTRSERAIPRLGHDLQRPISAPSHKSSSFFLGDMCRRAPVSLAPCEQLNARNITENAASRHNSARAYEFFFLRLSYPVQQQLQSQLQIGRPAQTQRNPSARPTQPLSAKLNARRFSAASEHSVLSLSVCGRELVSLPQVSDPRLRRAAPWQSPFSLARPSSS